MSQKEALEYLRKQDVRWVGIEEVAKALKITKPSAGTNLRKLYLKERIERKASDKPKNCGISFIFYRMKARNE